MKMNFKILSTTLLFLFSMVSLYAVQGNAPAKDASLQTITLTKITNKKHLHIKKRLIKKIEKRLAKTQPEKGGTQISGGLIGLGLILFGLSLVGLLVSIFVPGIAVFMLIALGVGILLGILGFLV